MAGIPDNAGHMTPREGGFHLFGGEQAVIQLPDKWSGRIWPRKVCCFDENTGSATLVEMTLGTSKSALHYYDESLVDGFNVPVSMMPVGGGVACGIAACETDLNVCCPSTSVVKRQGKVVGCKSACLAAKTDRYCCTGECANPKSCKLTIFGHLFKVICPKAYSFALDDASGLKTCKASRVSQDVLHFTCWYRYQLISTNQSRVGYQHPEYLMINHRAVLILPSSSSSSTTTTTTKNFHHHPFKSFTF
ncbi:hypothetical protein NC652_020578 [Populus alba x Populus x berolinensis]|nr:hypothetical protein NC652_020578 [Populus alba x Populus x berolinensis]